MKIVNYYKGCQYRNVIMLPTKGVIYNETLVHEWVRDNIVVDMGAPPGEYKRFKTITKCANCGIVADFSTKT